MNFGNSTLAIPVVSSLIRPSWVTCPHNATAGHGDDIEAKKKGKEGISVERWKKVLARRGQRPHCRVF